MSGLVYTTQQRLRGFTPALLLWAVLLTHSTAALAADVGPPAVTAPYATTLALPINLSGIAPDQVVAVEVTLTYDTQLLTLDGLQTAGHLLQNWPLVDSLRIDGGQIDTFKVIAVTETTDTLAADGSLFELLFSVADQRTPYTAAVNASFALLNAGTPVATAINGSVTVSGTTGTIIATPDLFETGDVLQVTVTDVDENLTAAADIVTVSVTNGGQTETLQAVETTPTSGIFTASIVTVFSAGSTTGDNLLQIKSGDQVNLCYDDVLDAIGTTNQRCTTLVPGHFGLALGATTTTIVVQPQDTMRVRLVDVDLNANAGVVETVQVNVSNSSTGENATILLSETGPNTDTFFGVVFTAFGAVAGPSGDDVLNVQKGDSLFVLYNDDATSSGKIVAVRDTCSVVDPFGDASANGAAQGFDAALILDHEVGNITLAGLDSLAANVDLQAPGSPITAFDATLVLQFRVGLIGHFPVQEDESANHPQPETDNSLPKLPLVERPLSLVAGPDYLALVAAERSDILAGHIAVRGFVGRVEPGADLENFLVAAGPPARERKISFAGARAVTGPGELLRFYQEVPAEIHLVEAHFNDGRLVGHLVEKSTAALPAHFALHANAPNPFNPETLIRYELPQTAAVRLDIYNAAGQKIRTLVQEANAAGVHEVIWDGRDQRGLLASSGMYFYQLATPNFRATRKMVLLK